MNLGGGGGIARGTKRLVFTVLILYTQKVGWTPMVSRSQRLIAVGLMIFDIENIPM